MRGLVLAIASSASIELVGGMSCGVKLFSWNAISNF